MSPSAHVVGLVEDDPIMGESLVQRLAIEGVVVKWWQRGQDALNRLAVEKFAAVICDIRLPDMDGEMIFREVTKTSAAPPFLFITGHGDIDQAVRLMRAGAGDYVTKPFEIEDFLVRLTGLIKPEINGSPTLGVSDQMRALERLLMRVALVRSTVLITGETGVGKEVAARFLHASSPVSTEPFVALNCAAIPPDLLESELFGHERGAFTGAGQRHRGYVERAGKGTLFLDEIGELKPGLQAKLLRLIEDRAFYRVGGETPLPFTARIVAATNAELGSKVEAGQFRADLFHRINVVAVRIPPLRERRDDIPWLLDRMFTDLEPKTNPSVTGISPMVVDNAFEHNWPGNVRELRNRIERGLVLATGTILMASDLFPDDNMNAEEAIAPSLEDVRADAERRHISKTLAAYGGEIAATARALGIGRTTLWEKMTRLNMRPESRH